MFRLAIRWRNAADLQKLSTLAQRWANGDIQTTIIYQNYNLEITNFNQNM